MLLTSASQGSARGSRPKTSDFGQAQDYLPEYYIDIVPDRYDIPDTQYGRADPMPRSFAYVRVSTTGQTTENQLREIEAAGFHVEPHRIVTETVSGSTAIAQRRGFSRLIDRLEAGDILIVTRLDRLGRDAIDVSATVRMLAAMGVRVYCLALGGADLTSSAGVMTMNVLNAVAQFERDLLVERTQSGLRRAKSEGKVLGRPPALCDAHRREVRADLAAGISVSSIARKFATSRQTIMRVRDERVAGPQE